MQAQASVTLRHHHIDIHTRLVNVTGAVSETIDFFDALMYKPGVVSTRR